MVTRDGYPLTLTRRKPASPVPGREPLLFINGIGQDRHTWDLGYRGLAPFMAGLGVDSWILEPRGLGLSRRKGLFIEKVRPYRWDFDTMVNGDLSRAVAYVREVTGAEKVFLCGHSLGGMMTYAFVPGRQEQVRGFITLGGPTVLGRGSLPMNLVFRANRVPLTGGRLTCAQALPFFPLGVVGRAALAVFPILNSRLESLIPLHPWHFRNVYSRDVRLILHRGFGKVAPGILRQMTVWATERVFTSRDRRVDYFAAMKKIRVPSLFFSGDRDRLAPVSSILPGYRLIPIPDKTFIHLTRRKTGVHWGHLDLTLGRHAPEWVWRKAGEWILERAGK